MAGLLFAGLLLVMRFCFIFYILRRLREAEYSLYRSFVLLFLVF